MDLTYIKQSGESNGDAGDQYTGLDRFGRVVDQRWIKTSDSSHTDRFQYGHDRDSSRLFRKNLVDAAFSELYHANGSGEGYDVLNQLAAFRRGTLSDSNSDNVPDTVTTASRSQVWDFDALGNWDTLTSDGTDKDRTHNKQNQITSIESQTTPAYDANGNMTTDENNKTLVYNAWNHLVQYKNGSTVLLSYAHDALGRRITRTESSTTTDLYYSAAWQVLEERVSGTARVQYVWSPVYVDALVERDRDTDSNGSLDERLYVQQDANYNVTALISTSGTVLERFVYDPYGQVTVLTASWGSTSGSSYAWVYLHQGGRFETVTGLYQFRHRDYSPMLGRWVQVDPILFSGGDSSLYRYVNNSPTRYLDPRGLQKITTLGGEEWPPPKQPAEPTAGQDFEWDVFIGVVLILGGMPFIPKEPMIGFPFTSLFSYAFGNWGRLRCSLPTWSPFLGWKRTPFLGRFVARWIPGVGWVLLAADAYQTLDEIVPQGGYQGGPFRDMQLQIMGGLP